MYYPESDKELLKQLKQILRVNGYDKTGLVEDKKENNDDPLELSRQCMLFSDINLLIFTVTGRRLGLTEELVFLTSDKKMINKVQFSLVVDVRTDQMSAIPDLSQSRIRQSSIKFEHTYLERN